MQVTVEDVSSLTKKMTITLSGDKVEKALNKAYKKLGSEVNFKGFRKGKVPRKVLEKNYGPQVRNEVSEELIQGSYFDALEETKLDAVVHPDIKNPLFVDDGSFVYEAEVDVRPEFELGKDKGLEIELPKIEVSDEEIEAELEEKRRQMAPLRNVEDRASREGDIVILDYEGFEDDKPIKQVVGKDLNVDIGSGTLGAEFEESLVGLKKGEETAKEIDFPADFPNPVLAGKKVRFDLKVKDVKERVLPELDDEFAKDVGDQYETLEDLKKDIHARRYKEKEDVMSGDMSDKIMMGLLEEHAFEVPKQLVEHEITVMIKQLEENLQGQNMTLESAGMNREQLKDQYRDTAEKRVRGDFILKKIAEVEEIKLENDDIESGFQRIADKYNMKIDEVKQYFTNRDDLLPFMSELLSEKILNFLKDVTTINYVEAAEGSDKDEEKSQSGDEA
mgnify:CR=1 FL=1